MWDRVKNLSYPDFNIYQKWKDRNNLTHPSTKTNQDINDSNNVDQFIKNSLDLVKSDSSSGIIIGVVISYTLLGLATWVLARPFYTGSVISLIFLWHSLWVDYIWPEVCLPGIEDNSSTFTRTWIYLKSELNLKLNDIYPIVLEAFNCIAELRNKNKELFCVLSTVFFLTVASIGTVLPGFYWALILLTATWLTKIAFQSLGLQPRSIWSSTDFEDLVPELTDDTILVLEKARASSVRPNESLVDGILPSCSGDHNLELTFSQSHFETLLLDNAISSQKDVSDFEEDFEVISEDELSY